MIGKRRLIRGCSLFLAATVLLQVTSCGTLLYPERRYKEPGNFDVGVAVLDGIGLLLFIIPGVIAFGVDFATGAIYVPKDEEAQAVPPSLEPERTEIVRVSPGDLNREAIEQVVMDRTGRGIDLRSEQLRVYELDENGRFIRRDESKPVPYVSRSDS